MKANYKKKLKEMRFDERSVIFRTKTHGFALYQQMLYGRTQNDGSVVYLDFANVEQIDAIINALTKLKDSFEENENESNSESEQGSSTEDKSEA